MPIEIKELHIKISVDDNPQSSDPAQNNRIEKEQIIAACVEQVMEILAKNRER
ncbi:DUF5908 family protein [Maribellus comscasis]|uniref:DUF5908 family protein n=1 Tax=Maribellus comscasis TaxID=2681766 RepID=UPI001C2DE349|nr:DUF5908 family protein [Maribellus comscasis]